MTTPDPCREANRYQDGAWYWVEREVWANEPKRIAPAMYKADCDAWYSYEFSGIPTRQLEVLEPCHRKSSASPKDECRWQSIKTAPKDKTILLGHRNSHGHWRTLRGEWFSQEEIDELWEDPDGVEPGWFETSVEADDVPNVWHTNPTHWQPLPAAPKLPPGE